jgi:hypothetical protein
MAAKQSWVAASLAFTIVDGGLYGIDCDTYPDAELTGGMFTAMEGLEVIIIPSGIYVAWKDHTPEACKKALKKLGLDVETGEDKKWWQLWK